VIFVGVADIREKESKEMCEGECILSIEDVMDVAQSVEDCYSITMQGIGIIL
jgi:hypothetical protein